MAILVFLLVVGVGVYSLELFLNAPTSVISITLSLLFGLPYSLGAIAAYLTTPTGDQSSRHYKIIPIVLVLTVLILGGVFLREGVICMVILAPLWWVSAYLGAITVRNLHKAFLRRGAANISVLIALPFLIFVLEDYKPPTTDEFTITRTITINASIGSVWPHLLEMEDIEPQEGKWNISQNLLGIPRPISAVVVGAGVDARRMARWGNDISFEEHISIWEESGALQWKFVFPNSSVHQYTDKHISPDGEHLKIISGGYNLTVISPTMTKLTLDTMYSATTPVNYYSAVWGELIIGDIQSNILQIVKDRSEVGT